MLNGELEEKILFSRLTEKPEKISRSVLDVADSMNLTVCSGSGGGVRVVIISDVGIGGFEATLEQFEWRRR